MRNRSKSGNIIYGNKFLIFLVIIISLLIGSSLMGWLTPVINFLNNEAYTMSVGSVSFTPYVVIKDLFIVLFLFWLAGFLLLKMEKYVRAYPSMSASTKILFIKVLQIIVYFFFFLIGMGLLGIDLTALTVFGGAVGIGLGFGLQKITSNFISGLILLFEKSVEIGDFVELNTGVSGFIRHTGARYSLVETLDGKEIMIPNEDFITSQVTNCTFSFDRVRMELNIGVSYGADLDLVYKLILEAASESDRCVEDPPPKCYLMDFGDSSVNFMLHFWQDDIKKERWRPRSDILFAVWRKFREHGVEIPFPQRDIHIKSDLSELIKPKKN